MADVDECKRFHPEVCKNGVCVNNIPGYNCYCSSGYVYNRTLLECVGVYKTHTGIHARTHTHMYTHTTLKLKKQVLFLEQNTITVLETNYSILHTTYYFFPKQFILSG